MRADKDTMGCAKVIIWSITKSSIHNHNAYDEPLQVLASAHPDIHNWLPTMHMQVCRVQAQIYLSYL